MSKQSPTSQYCCIKMLANVETGTIIEVSSGFYLPSLDGDNHCMDGNPSAKFCPFCGAEFETLTHDGRWDWRVKV